MKRNLLYLYTLLLLTLSIGVSACSNEDIDIQRVGQLEVRVSTQHLYDTFTSTNSIKTRFLAEDYSIGVTVFVYDENGIKVDEQFKHSKTFDTLSFSYPNLTEGQYTFIVAETLVEDNLDYKSDDWVFKNTSSLSTLEIQTNPESSYGDYHYWYSVVGTAASSRYLNFEESTVINLTPQAIGCVINYEAIHFANTDYAAVKFLTKDTPAGRYLSPEYEDNDRFHYDQYLGSNTWSGRGMVWIKDNEDMSGADVYLIETGNTHYVFGTFKTDASGYLESTFYAWPNNGADFKTYDGEIYYGGIAYQSNNGSASCTTSLFREEANYNEWETRILNTTPPSTNVAYLKPYLVWGASSSAVSSYMSGLSGATSFTNSNGDSNILSYINFNQSVQYDYYFDNEWKNYNYLLMAFTKSSYSIESISPLLADMNMENGGYVEEVGGYIYYNTNNSALVYYPESYPDYIFVIIVPNTSASPKKALSAIKGRAYSKASTLSKAPFNKPLRKETLSGR